MVQGYSLKGIDNFSATTEMVPDFFGPQEIWSPENLVPEKFGPREIWSPRNLVPEKFGPQEIWSQKIWAP